MKEVTRIHIAKTAYDIEITAKKQLEKYIKSLESYTQDADVLMDIEIRVTELLAERGVRPGGVIAEEDVAAVRAQLGEPYEFAGEGGDIAIGDESYDSTPRRLYRSLDDAVLGGVLSGVAGYLGINPLWIRLVFIVLLFISFGTAAIAYMLVWILVPPARTAAEKLRLAGKDVTLESIKMLNAEEEQTLPNPIAPRIKKVLTVGLGTLSALVAVATLAFTVTILVATLTSSAWLADITNGFMGLGSGNSWIVWLVFWIVIAGLCLFTSLCGLIAYAFYSRTLTKRVFISCVIIVALGITSVAAAVGIASTQSWRVANETRSMMRETKANVPQDFAAVKSVNFIVSSQSSRASRPDFFGSYAAIRYVVDPGAPRYELTALPSARASVTIEGTQATVTLTIPESFRNSFVQPILTMYGPALESIVASASDVAYAGTAQESLVIHSKEQTSLAASGVYASVVVEGAGSVDLGSSAVQVLDVRSSHNLTLAAGTVRELIVTQPEVCPSDTPRDATSVRVAGVTSDTISYNGELIPARTHRTGCAVVEVTSPQSFDGPLEP